MASDAKIGIITYCYNTFNFGAVLQAYALCAFLNKKGYKAEQIFYMPAYKTYTQTNENSDLNITNKKRALNYLSIRTYYRLFKGVVRSAITKSKFINNRLSGKDISRTWEIRCKNFEKFWYNIPHSRQIYYKNTIDKSVLEYDTFIVGSDQVWNPDWLDKTYLLEFAENRKKISYATSVGKSSLSDEQKAMFRDTLKDFYAISIREESMSNLFGSIIPNKNIEWVLDPTLLLDKEDWDKITSKKLYKHKYIFCYFFGEDDEVRNLARAYAKKHKLKIATIPHLYPNKETSSDKKFGDYQLFDVKPSDFVTLIKHAECVFTNSFHACVFACIYSVKFFVFNRKDKDDMLSRIYTICKIFGCGKNFCDDKSKVNLEYLESVEQGGNVNTKSFKQMRLKSEGFLINNI